MKYFKGIIWNIHVMEQIYQIFSHNLIQILYVFYHHQLFVLQAQGTYFHSIFFQQIGILARQNDQIFVYVEQFNFAQFPQFLNPIELTQDQQNLTCESFIFLTKDQLLVDCYYVSEEVLNNLWQIVYLNNNTVKVVQSSNVMNQLSSWKNVSRKVYQQNDLVYRGILSSGMSPSSISIFRLVDGIPQEQPNQTFYFQNLVNYQVMENNDMFTLSMSSGLYFYKFEDQQYDNKTQVEIYEGYKYNGFQIFESQSGQKEYNLLVSISSSYDNLLEYIISNDELRLVGVYNGEQIKFQGRAIQINQTVNFVSIQSDESIQVFERIILNSKIDLQSKNLLYVQNSSNVELFKTINLGIMVNYNDGYGSVFYGGYPKLQQQFMDSGQLVIQGRSRYNEKYMECSAVINYNLLQEQDEGIYSKNKTLPNLGMYPYEIEMDMNEYFDGPALQVQGQIEQDEQKQGSYFQQSSISQLQQVPQSNYSDVSFLSNHINPYNQDLWQLIQANNSLLIQICSKSGSSLLCSANFTQSTIYPINSISIQFQSTNQSDQGLAYLLFPSSYSQLTLLYINHTQTNIAVQVQYLQCDSYISFTIISQYLFVVYSSSIAVQTLDDLQIQYSIDSSNFQQQFNPIQVLGDIPLLGPVILINNKQQCLIYSLIQGQVLNVISYPIQEVGIVTYLQLIGTNLLISQVKNEIIQYSLVNIYAPLLIKSLPLYQYQISQPQLIQSEYPNLYVLVNGSIVLKYDINQQYHNCLIQIFNINTKIFSFGQSVNQQYLSYLNNTVIETYLVNQYPQIILSPGQYYNNYCTNINYSLNASNVMNFSESTVKQNMSIMNSYINIRVNESDLNISTTTLSIQFNLTTHQLQDIVLGQVNKYTAYCDQCESVELTNFINLNSSFKSSLADIQVITDTGLVQTLHGIYQILPNQNITQLDQFNQVYQSCPILSTNQNYLLSICQFDFNTMTVQLYDQNYTKVQMKTLNNLMKPIQAQIVQDKLFILAIDLTLSSTATVIVSYTIDNFEKTDCTYICSELGINGFDITQLNEQYYLMFYTCVDNLLGVKYLGLQNQSDILQLNSNQTNLNVQSIYQLKQTTEYYQIKTIGLNESMIRVLITTNNMISMIFDYEYQEGQIMNSQLISVIPPYGNMNLTNTLVSYLDNKLVLLFSQANNMYLLAAYNLENITTNHILIQNAIILQEPPIFGQYQSSLYIYTSSLNQYLISPNLTLNVTFTSPFKQVPITIIATNQYSQGQFYLFMNYQTSDSPYSTPWYKIFPWYGWVIIVLAIGMIIYGIWLIFQRKKKRALSQSLASLGSINELQFKLKE